MNHMSKLVRTFFLGGLISLVFATCTLASLTPHQTQKKLSANPVCSSICHPHDQATASLTVSDKEEDDDKEPVPPVLEWLVKPVSLASLYLLPLGHFIGHRLKPKVLLTTQLRF